MLGLSLGPEEADEAKAGSLGAGRSAGTSAGTGGPWRGGSGMTEKAVRCACGLTRGFR